MLRTFLVIIKIEMQIKSEFAKILFDTDLGINYKKAIVFAMDKENAKKKALNAHLMSYSLNNLNENATITFNVTEITDDVTWLK